MSGRAEEELEAFRADSCVHLIKRMTWRLILLNNHLGRILKSAVFHLGVEDPTCLRARALSLRTQDTIRKLKACGQQANDAIASGDFPQTAEAERLFIEARNEIDEIIRNLIQARNAVMPRHLIENMKPIFTEAVPPGSGQ